MVTEPRKLVPTPRTPAHTHHGTWIALLVILAVTIVAVVMAFVGPTLFPTNSSNQNTSQPAESAVVLARARDLLAHYGTIQFEGTITTESSTTSLPIVEDTQEVTIRSSVAVAGSISDRGTGDVSLTWTTSVPELSETAYPTATTLTTRTLEGGRTYTQSSVTNDGAWSVGSPGDQDELPAITVTSFFDFFRLMATDIETRVAGEEEQHFLYTVPDADAILDESSRGLFAAFQTLDRTVFPDLDVPPTNTQAIWFTVNRETGLLTKIEIQQVGIDDTTSVYTDAIVVLTGYNSPVVEDVPETVGAPAALQSPVDEVADTADVVREEDVQRLADLETIQGLLEAYRTDRGAYPVSDQIVHVDGSDQLTRALVPTYADTLPYERDTQYYYGYASDGQTYTLSALLTKPYAYVVTPVGDRYLVTLTP